MSRKIILVLLAASMMLWGCSIIVDQQLVDMPAVTFKGMSLKRVSLFESAPMFNFKITNPNPMGLYIRNIAYNFKIGGKKFIKGIADKEVWLKPLGAEMLNLSVTFNYMDVFGTGSAFIHSDKVAYELSGYVGAGAFAIPYHTAGEVGVPEPLGVSLKYVDVSDFSMTRPFTLTFAMGLKNPSPELVELEGLDYSIKLSGQTFAQGTIRRIPFIEKNSGLTLSVSVEVSPAQLDWSMNNILTHDSSEYELSGGMRFYIRRIGERNIPFRKRGRVPFRK